MRGYIYSLEVIIAVFLIASIVLLGLFSAPTKTPYLEDIRRNGENIISSIRKNETIRNNIVNKNLEFMDNFLENFIPTTIDHSYEICNQTICLGERLNKIDTMVFVSFFSSASKFEPVEFKLYLAPGVE